MGAGTPVERRHSRLRLPTRASKELPSADRDSNASSGCAPPMKSPNALHSAGNNCVAAKAYPAADGWNMSCENRTSGALWNSGASRSENGTGAPPADRTAAAWERARRNPRLRDGGEEAEDRAGAHDDDGAAAPKPSHRPAQPACRRSDAVRLGDVVGADHDDRRVR